MTELELKMIERHSILCECGLHGVRLDEDCQVYAALWEGAEIEREECARLCEADDDYYGMSYGAAIRARGTK